MVEHTTGDDRLLAALGAALRPDATTVEPSPAELTAFRTVVASQAAPSGDRARSSSLRRWSAGLLAGAVVLSGGTAYATNPVAPRPVRSAAFALKLPVEAPDLTDAKRALDALERQLHEGRREDVAAAVEDVEEELADLSVAARRPLESRAATLLAAAAAFLRDPLTDGGDDEDRSAVGERDSSGPGSGTGSSDDDASGDDHSGPDGGADDEDEADDDDRSSGSGTTGTDGSDDDSSGSTEDSSEAETSGEDSGSSGTDREEESDEPDASDSGSDHGDEEPDGGGVSASGAETDETGDEAGSDLLQPVED